MRRRLRFLPFMVGVSVVLAVVAAVVGYLVAGGASAVGAASGVAFVAIAYTLSSVGIAWVETVNRAMMLGAALIAYTGKIWALFVIMSAAADAHWAGLKAMGFGVGAAALVWIIAQAWWIWHAKIPYVQFED